MSTMSRALAKTFMKSLSAFKVVKDMVRRAVDPTKPSLVKSLAKNRIKLDEAFLDLCYCFENFKEDILAAENISEDVFNEKDEEEKSKFQYNDNGWKTLEKNITS